MPSFTAYYVVVEIAAAANYMVPLQRPVIGPLTELQCQSMAAAILAEKAPAVASVACLQPIMFRSCTGRGGWTIECPAFKGDW